MLIIFDWKDKSYPLLKTFLMAKKVCFGKEVIRVILNATFNNIPVISWGSALLVEENRSTRRKPPTCRKSLTNCIT